MYTESGKNENAAKNLFRTHAAVIKYRLAGFVRE